MNTFDPVKYSREELAFLLENVGKSPLIALMLPLNGASPQTLRPILQEVFDREHLKAVDGIEWVGIEAIKETIRNWIREDAKNENAYKRSRGKVPRNPSMYVRDAKGVYHFAAPGSDSDRPRSFIDEKGRRIPYEIPLDAPEANPWVEEEIVSAAPVALLVDESKARIECPICHHTESWNIESRLSFNAARARMSKHLKNPMNKEVQLHQELYTMEFHS
jgi:hypothetical protein